jgi:hypothetical protein
MQGLFWAIVKTILVAAIVGLIAGELITALRRSGHAELEGLVLGLLLGATVSVGIYFYNSSRRKKQ